MKFADLGTNNVKDSTAFKKIQYFSKTNPQQLYGNVSEFNLRYKKLADLYLNDSEPTQTNNYGTLRQHNFTSLSSSTNNFNSLLDSKSLDTFMDYNLTSQQSNNRNILGNSTKLHSREESFDLGKAKTLPLQIVNNVVGGSNVMQQNYTHFPSKNSFLSAENDAKQFKNPFKFALNNKWSKKNFTNLTWSNDAVAEHEVSLPSPMARFSTKFSNESLSFRFKDLKSPGTSLLTSERNARMVDQFASGKTQLNATSNANNLNAVVENGTTGSVAGLQQSLFNSAAVK